MKARKIRKAKKERENGKVEIICRKSQLMAATEYDYQKLGRSYDGLLACTIEIMAESVKFVYDTCDVDAWDYICTEEKELQLAALFDVKRLAGIAKQFKFTLKPENLYYDIQGRVYVRDRDIYEENDAFSEEEFCRQYKALLGCTVCNKYKYEDYYEGGLDLLKENEFLKEIYECTEINEIANSIKSEYEYYKEVHKNKFIEVAKIHYKAQKVAFAVIVIISIAALTLCGYIAIWKSPYEAAVAKAYEAYLESDYEATVDAMAEVSIDRMNSSQKYILAVASVKCENFNTLNQSNILKSISLNGDEKVMEYWIHINRLETIEAEDIAMQLSSDQLLYYAYLKEKVVVENDSTLTGEEKQTRISALESKLEPLKKEYSSLTEE